jgi:hypothetical protein
MTADVSARPRPQDVQQLEWAQQMHRTECEQCLPGQPCPMGQRLGDAVRRAGGS